MKKTATILVSMILVLVLFCSCGLTDKLNGTDSDGKKYQKYVKGLMDGSYKGDINSYMSVCEASKEDAQSNYDNYILYYVRSILYTFGFDDYTTLPKSVVDDYTEYTKKMINEAKYTVDKGEKKNKEWYVTVHINPMNVFTDKMVSDCTEYINDFTSKYTQDELANMSDEEYEKLLTEYLTSLLDIIKKDFDDREYKDEVVKELKININESTYSVDDDLWLELDNLILDFGDESDESAESSESADE